VLLLSSLENIIQQIRKELVLKNEIREQTHENMRKVTSFSKQSILLLHQKKLSDAEQRLFLANEIIEKLKKQAVEHPESIYGGMFSAALQEYAEAKILLILVNEGRFVNPEEIEVPYVEYVLGLADVIGECRRLALDSLRDDQVEKGVQYLEIMDQIFIQLLALDEAYMLVPGLRHKSDISRRIIENTRGDITIEVRRKALENYLKKIDNSQEKQSKNKQVKIVRDQV